MSWSFDRPQLDLRLTSDNVVSKNSPKIQGKPLPMREETIIPYYSLDYESNPYRTVERLQGK